MKIINQKNYTETALFCAFGGAFGIHRLINKQYISGGFLLGTNVVMTLVNLISEDYAVFFWPVGLFIYIWVFVDLIRLLTNNYRGLDNEIIGYTGRFMENKTNKIIFVWLIISIIGFVFLLISSFAIIMATIGLLMGSGM
ncbi:MAG: hypothetical protein ACRCUP_06525 [Mycoplasmatales bacterium]